MRASIAIIIVLAVAAAGATMTMMGDEDPGGVVAAKTTVEAQHDAEDVGESDDVDQDVEYEADPMDSAISQ